MYTKFLRKMSGRVPEPEMEPISKTELTAAEENAILAAIRPSIARQRAQSKERNKYPERGWYSERGSVSEPAKFPHHPRMSQARQAAAKAYWDAPLTGGEWHRHPSTGRLVPREVLDDERMSTPRSPTDALNNDTGPGSNENEQSSPNSFHSERSSVVVVTRPQFNMNWNTEASKSTEQSRIDSVMGPLQPEKKQTATSDWKTPGEESRAYIAQLEGSTRAGSNMILKRSRSVPSSRLIICEGGGSIVRIDGASMTAVASFEVPPRKGPPTP